ncbi:hypothetical protein [Rufibacter sp. XAAS-G3-1]|uniref:hypothetical protein n=1 Tax=Rufibacter sp. XAAS-G3-1 TaxID=2729134 RepID=UPI0015E75DA7|nr:hypothetical protein [Rufibacter sp. XAAS-G3-1]
MSRLRERTIQLKAVEELRKFYFRKEGNENIYSAIEVRTRKEKGNKRADGIICFETKNKEIFTVSLEAKSHKTLGDLTSLISDDKIIIQSLVVSAIITFSAITTLAILLNLQWYYLSIIGLGTFAAFFILAFWLLDKLDLDNHKIISVIEQLKQYPANEQWIAYSTYTDNLLSSVTSNFKKNHLQILDSLCNKNGFGLMLIGNKTAKILYEPKFKKGYYLNNYCKEDTIKEFLKTGISLKSK